MKESATMITVLCVIYVLEMLKSLFTAGMWAWFIRHRLSIIYRLKSSDGNINDPLILHDLIEKVILLKHAVERGRKAPLSITSDVMIDRFRYRSAQLPLYLLSL